MSLSVSVFSLSQESRPDYLLLILGQGERTCRWSQRGVYVGLAERHRGDQGQAVEKEMNRNLLFKYDCQNSRSFSGFDSHPL